MKTSSTVVAKTGDLQPDEMKEVKVGETRILLARVGENYHATSATCTHYGAPLVDGVIHDGRIVCPWHHACFDARTGGLQDPPALDALACFDLTIDGENIVLHLPEDPPDRATPEMSRRDPASTDVTVIIGGGAAGYTAAQTLREDRYGGRIVMISRDDRHPYDRPNLSKDYLHGHADPEWMPLRPEEFFNEHDIEVMLGREVTSVDIAARSITLDNGETLFYNNLLVATGGTPRRFDLPGADLGNILTLRSFSDADAIIAAASGGSRAVVIGASFIGMEAAFSLRKRGLDVTVVAPEPVPFAKTLGHEIGALFQQLHEENGVSFRLGASVTGFAGEKSVEAVLLEGDERLEADLVIAGIGVELATGFLDGIPLGRDGSITVDEHLSAAPGIYAAGDIASYPDARTGEKRRIEHWRTAEQQGRVAAHNIAGRKTRFDGVPFFWTRQFDLGLDYIGYARKWDEIIWDGDVAERNFLAYYVLDGKVVAVAGMERNREMAALEELMRLDRMPAPEELRAGEIDVVERLGGSAERGGRS
jgi:apoptosis-inducing factor 3